jgi:hypothetical protein
MKIMERLSFPPPDSAQNATRIRPSPRRCFLGDKPVIQYISRRRGGRYEVIPHCDELGEIGLDDYFDTTRSWRNALP